MLHKHAKKYKKGLSGKNAGVKRIKKVIFIEDNGKKTSEESEKSLMSN